MSRDPMALVRDAIKAVELVRQFTAGRTYADYRADAMLRSAVERQLGIVGEALNRLSQMSPESAAMIHDLPRIVAFRNTLVHGYATVDNALVWAIVQERLDALRNSLYEVAE